MAPIGEVLDRLMQVIESRRASDPGESYTARLLSGGVAAIGAKVTEEAEEVVEAAGGPASERHRCVVHESADLLYHLWVLLAACHVSLDDVSSELTRRFGTSGLAEKASRTRSEGASDGD